MPLALVGLLDLFEHVRLDPAALDTATDPVVRGRAVLEALRGLAAMRATIVAIDDLQWLDSVSARTLRYVLRRLDAEPVGVLTTLRLGWPTDPLAAASALPPGRCETLELGPLSTGALRRVIGREVTTVSRPTLKRIAKVSGGNPLYALELARSLTGDLEGSLSWAGSHLPDSLQAAVAERIGKAPADVAPLLETVSALGRSSVPELREALPDSDVDALLTTAREHELLVVGENLDVEFSHPIVASVVYGRMSPLERRALHGRLVERATDADVGARHLALSSDDPDAAVAQSLEEAAERAGGRAAHDVAAELAGHSLRLTPVDDPDARERRALAEIRFRAVAGEVGRALELADHLIASLPPGPGRARALLQRAELESDDLVEGEGLLRRALEDAGEDEALRGRVLDQLGWLQGQFRGDLAAGIDSLRRALEVAERTGDVELEMSVAGALGNLEFLAGTPRLDLVERAVALEEQIGEPLLWGGPRSLLAGYRRQMGDLVGARTLWEATYTAATASSNERWRPIGLYSLASLECYAGDFVRAEELVLEAIESAHDNEHAHVEGWLLYILALVQAWRGRADEARATASRVLEWAEPRGHRPVVARVLSLLGLLALSESDSEGAAHHLRGALALVDEMGIANPANIPALTDAIDALSGLGDVETAAFLLDRLDGQADALDNPHARALAERSRGVVLLAGGEPEAACPPLERAREAFEQQGFLPEVARAELSLGRALVRGGHRSRAADVLADARDRFATMGARLWEARAAEELERVAPGRATGELTATETRVAGLVAAGLKNREIAATLYMSVATVEAHLTRIYRKLGIRSRSELTRLVAAGEIPVVAESGTAVRQQ